VKEKVSSSEKVVKAIEPVKPVVVEAAVDTKKGESLISKIRLFCMP
jgi:hypothetical protein